MGRLEAEPVVVASGVDLPFQLRIVRDPDGPVTTVDELHERTMHLIVVRRDLTGFQHLHPEMEDAGTWRTTLVLPSGGVWRAFADFATEGTPTTLGVDRARDGPLRTPTAARPDHDRGIGRATLYKYFPDVESILLAWHDRQIAAHLAHLSAIRDRASGATKGLGAVLEAYAFLSRQSRGHEDVRFVELLHRDDRLRRAQRQVHRMIRELIAAAAEEGVARDDVPPDELASYCVNALAGAAGQRTNSAVHRLVSLTMDGLRSQRGRTYFRRDRRLDGLGDHCRGESTPTGH